MCQPNGNFKLCSCGRKATRPGKLKVALRSTKAFARFIKPQSAGLILESEACTWYLYQRSNHHYLIGDLLMDPEYLAREKEKHKTYQFLVDALNTRTDCFDFAYQPASNDWLCLKLNDHVLLYLTYEQGRWRMEQQADVMEDWDHWLLNNGQIKM